MTKSGKLVTNATFSDGRAGWSFGNAGFSQPAGSVRRNFAEYTSETVRIARALKDLPDGEHQVAYAGDYWCVFAKKAHFFHYIHAYETEEQARAAAARMTEQKT